MPEKTVYIKFFSSVSEKSVKNLMNVIEQKLKEEASKFVLLISSGGGNVFAGISA